MLKCVCVYVFDVRKRHIEVSSREIRGEAGKSKLTHHTVTFTESRDPAAGGEREKERERKTDRQTGRKTVKSQTGCKHAVWHASWGIVSCVHVCCQLSILSAAGSSHTARAFFCFAEECKKFEALKSERQREKKILRWTSPLIMCQGVLVFVKMMSELK